MTLTIAYAPERDAEIREWWATGIPRVTLAAPAAGTIGGDRVLLHSYAEFTADEVAAIKGVATRFGILWTGQPTMLGFVPDAE